MLALAAHFDQGVVTYWNEQHGPMFGTDPLWSHKLPATAGAAFGIGSV